MENIHSEPKGDLDIQGFDAETVRDCYEDVREAYLGLKSPDEIRSKWVKHYDAKLIDLTLRRIMAELEDLIYWGEPATIIGDPSVRFWYDVKTKDSPRWKHYFDKLQASDHLGEETLTKLDDSTSKILGLCGNPSTSSFKSRGLVMGHVQSGKTTNFLGLAAKAADSKYRLIIVLSGLTNNLRNQTQTRLQEMIEGDAGSWHLLTHDNQDFRSTTANAQNLCQDGSNRMIAVVKKNKSRLVSLRKWLENVHQMTRDGMPVLVIDDECDQATTNTGTQESRAAINRELAKLLDSKFLPKVSYVGYTATPFANILADTTDLYGTYPKDFIVSLTKAPGYFGAQELFGSQLEDEEGVDSGVDIIRDIPNIDVAMVAPPKKRQDVPLWGPQVPASLEEAINWFVIATATRRARGQGDKWSTMMVHTSSNVKPHEKTMTMIQDHIDYLKGREKTVYEAELKLLWEREINKASDLEPQAVRDWTKTQLHLDSVLQEIAVIMDNSASVDRLDYSPGVKNFPVIVVGGNTLARGLTLEGLVSSYFLRTTNAYDSLMQMGRWFGYRPNYGDLPRLWLSNESPYKTKYWFRELAEVESEIRDQIEIYAIEKRTPLELGIRIKSLPGMAITAAAKMKNAEQAQVGYGGTRQQTILFEADSTKQKENLQLVNSVFTNLGSSTWIDNGNKWLLNRGVNSSAVIDFVDSYHAHKDIRTLQKNLVHSYISNLNSEGELLKWNIVIYSNSKQNATPYALSSTTKIRLASRSKMKGEENINIKALISLGDMVADKPSLKTGAVNPDTNKVSEAKLWERRGADPETSNTPLLGIYIIDKDSVPQPNRKFRAALNAENHLVGYFMVFPETKSKFNSTYFAPNLGDNEAIIEDPDDPFILGDDEEE
jgi:hypothetical protein